MKRANVLIEEYCLKIDYINYVNIVDSMMNEDGTVKPDIFKWDGIHLNTKGCKILIDIVKPLLLSVFLNES